MHKVFVTNLKVLNHLAILLSLWPGTAPYF